MAAHIVTGGTGALGREVVRALLAGGASVAGPYRGEGGRRGARGRAPRKKAHGVRVNWVMPGLVHPPEPRPGAPGAYRSGWPPPAALARVIVFLLSPESAPVAGGVVPVDAHA